MKNRPEDLELAAAIEEFASLQFSDSEIAAIVQVNLEELIAHKTDIARGRLRAEAEVRKALLQAAKDGDSHAQKIFLTLNEQAKAASRW